MAPPPEYDKEPKAPDKSISSISTDDSKVLYNHVKDHTTNADHKAATTGANEVENNKHVETLDDGQLRALLDEAITYKCPKDREGKSILFKNLLQEVEQDEQACEAAARELGAGRGGRRGRGRREHHSSLQDLVAAMAGEAAPRRGRAPPAHAAPPAASVSARALHGGSLPSGVDTSFLLSEEASVCAGGAGGAGGARGGYLATVRCVNPPPLAERRVSAGDAAPEPAADDALARRSKPMFPVTYTARATLEIGSGSVCSGRAVTTTTASNQVDSAIPFSCITTPEVVASCNTTSSTSQTTIAVDPKPRSVISSNFNGLPLSRPGYVSTTTSNTDEYKKSLDENGNAVQGFTSPLSGSSQHKKPRRKKSSKNETVITSHQIDGYQGNKDLNEVLRFIESHADGARAPKLRAKHHDCEDKGKKRSTERRKDKEHKLQRASSLEELSRTTLADLTDTPAPDDTVSAPAKPERRSWGDDERALSYRAPAAPAPAPATPVPAPDPAPQELTDFQTVTKKRKPRRRADDADRDRASRRVRAPSPEPRRAPPPAAPASAPTSAPASDRSNDSNDDMDSVHSLPAAAPPALTTTTAITAPPALTATTTIVAPPAPPAPPPPPAPPHASYADIARTRQNIPDLIESCNFYAEGEVEQRAAEQVAAGGEGGEGAGAGEAELYPALAARRKPAARGERARKEPDVVADRRPPVILLDSAARPRDMDGVTFGFDVNEQLLAPRRARCDLLRDAEPGVAVRAGRAALRYVPPAPRDSAHLHQIVDYVGAAWDDVVRCGGGKVRYFSE